MILSYLVFKKFFSKFEWEGWCNLCNVFVLIWWICLCVMLNCLFIFFNVWLVFILILKCICSILVLCVVKFVSILFVVLCNDFIVVELIGELIVVFLMKLFKCEFLLLLIGVFIEIGFFVILSILWILFLGINICLVNFFGFGLWFIFCSIWWEIWFSLLIVLIICIGIWMVCVWLVIECVIVWWIYYVV